MPIFTAVLCVGYFSDCHKTAPGAAVNRQHLTVRFNRQPKYPTYTIINFNLCMDLFVDKKYCADIPKVKNSLLGQGFKCVRLSESDVGSSLFLALCGLDAASTPGPQGAQSLFRVQSRWTYLSSEPGLRLRQDPTSPFWYPVTARLRVALYPRAESPPRWFPWYCYFTCLS